MSNIYQKLWDLDLENNGCSVSARDPRGNWINPDADILLDEQKEAVGRIDTAPNPLFHRVKDEVLTQPTYKSAIALLNNYIINARQTEDHIGDNEVEDRERENFLDVCMATDVMKKALEYIQDELQIELDNQKFREHIQHLWFSIYTNYFNRNAVSFCSGFEHIFVGEASGRGGIGGYHSWLKYYLDEKNQRVDFKGYNYDKNFNRSSSEGKQNPFVATIKMLWQPVDIHGNNLPVREKDQGGFFVGPSPELQIAIPTVAYFESTVNKYRPPEDVTKKDVTLQNGLFSLVLYRNTNEDQTRGDKLRSFFPKFRRIVESDSTGEVIPAEGDVNSGDISIVRAMVNPEGDEVGKEWVILENNTSRIISLDGWAIVDRKDRKQKLSGKIEPNKFRKIVISRESANSAQLTNSGGKIELVDVQNKVIAKVEYGRVPEGKIAYFVSSDDS